VFCSRYTTHSPCTCGGLDGRVGSCWDATGLIGSIMPIHNSQHWCYQADSKDIICIGKEPGAGDSDGADVVPSERRFIDLRQSETTSFIGVGDVGIIVVEVVEGSIPSLCSGGHLQGRVASTKISSIGTKSV